MCVCLCARGCSWCLGCLSALRLGGRKVIRDRRRQPSQVKRSQVKRNSVSLPDRQEWEEGQCMHVDRYCNKEEEAKSKTHVEIGAALI